MADEKVFDAQQELLNAMYTIAMGVVSKQKFDETKICTVLTAYTNSKGAKTGVYQVKSQDAVFDAYAQQGAEYFEQQQVYVSIPNGNYDNNKFIVGRYVEDDEKTL